MIQLLVGKLGSGKTSFARDREEKGAVRFSLDEWMIRLYGQHMSDELREERSARCRRLFLDMAIETAALGVDVVLDCGFWKRSERAAARERLRRAGLPVEILFFDLPVDERWRRLCTRNEKLPADCYEITREMFEAFETRFEPLGPDEPAIRAAYP
jgi:predicted kinase